MKSSRTRGGGADIVRVYRAESNHAEIDLEDMKVTSNVCIRRVTVSHDLLALRSRDRKSVEAAPPLPKDFCEFPSRRRQLE